MKPILRLAGYASGMLGISKMASQYHTAAMLQACFLAALVVTGGCSDSPSPFRMPNTSQTDAATVVDSATPDFKDATNDRPDATIPDGEATAERVTLGFWDGMFTPATSDGESFTVVAGPQGGYHIDIAASIDIDEIDGTQLRVNAFRLPDRAPLATEVFRILDRSRTRRIDSRWLWAGDRIVLDIDSPEDIAGQQIEITVNARRNAFEGVDSSRGVANSQP